MPLLNEKPLDVEYMHQMQCHPFGTALYRPQPYNIFHPGIVGYFDLQGNWNPIYDLSSSSSLPTAGTLSLSPPETVPAFAKPESHTWGPKLGTSTHSRNIDLQAVAAQGLLAATAGIPLSIGCCCRFESEKSTGAVLMTSAPVVHERLYYEAPLKRWAAANAGRLLAERPEVKTHGMWIVTSTWAADEVAVNCWRDQRKAVDVGFSVGFVEIGEIAPKGEWADGGAADGWIKVKKDEAGGSRVVFFGGLYFKYRLLTRGLTSTNRRAALRAETDEEETIATCIPAEDGMEYDLCCESVFEDEALRKRDDTYLTQEISELGHQDGQDNDDDVEDW